MLKEIYQKCLLIFLRYALRDHCQISPVILNEFNRINQVHFPLKSSENHQNLMENIT